MSRHPLEGRGVRRPGRTPTEPISGAATRRQFLQFGALAAAAGAGALAGCERKRPQQPTPSNQVVLSRPDHPTTLKLYPDVPAIADGLSPETGGTLKLFNYAEYISPDVIKKFGKDHNVGVEVTTFTTQDE